MPAVGPRVSATSTVKLLLAPPWAGLQFWGTGGLPGRQRSRMSFSALTRNWVLPWTDAVSKVTAGDPEWAVPVAAPGSVAGILGTGNPTCGEAMHEVRTRFPARSWMKVPGVNWCSRDWGIPQSALL